MLRGTGALVATYGEPGEGGTARFYAAVTAQELRGELDGMFASMLAGDVR